MSKVATVILSVFLAIILIGAMGGSIFFNATPMGRAMWNTWFHAVQKTDDDTNYATKKKVEDTCRAMIASYNSDKLTYEQYKSANSTEKLGWAEQAKMRANKTASTYNNFILKNSYVWESNAPSDIYMTLPFLE